MRLSALLAGKLSKCALKLAIRHIIPLPGQIQPDLQGQFNLFGGALHS